MFCIGEEVICVNDTSDYEGAITKLKTINKGNNYIITGIRRQNWGNRIMVVSLKNKRSWYDVRRFSKNSVGKQLAFNFGSY